MRSLDKQLAHELGRLGGTFRRARTGPTQEDVAAKLGMTVQDFRAKFERFQSDGPVDPKTLTLQDIIDFARATNNEWRLDFYEFQEYERGTTAVGNLYGQYKDVDLRWDYGGWWTTNRPYNGETRHNIKDIAVLRVDKGLSYS